MQNARFSIAVCVAAAALIAGCSGGTHVGSSIPPTNGAVTGSVTRTAAGATMKITVPASTTTSATTRAAKYVSPATQSLVAYFAPPTTPAPSPSPTPNNTNVDATRRSVRAVAAPTAEPTGTLVFAVNLAPTNPNCSASVLGALVCTVTFPVPAGTYLVNIGTYDAPQPSPSASPYPTPVGNLLSNNTGIPATIVSGQANALNVTLAGVPAAFVVNFAPSSAVGGSQATGYSYDRCAAPQTADIIALDADGNYILGPGAPAIAASDDDGALSFPTPSAAAPNHYTVSFANGFPYPGESDYVSAVAGGLDGFQLVDDSTKRSTRSLTTPTLTTLGAMLTFTSDYCGVATTVSYTAAAPLGGIDTTEQSHSVGNSVVTDLFVSSPSTHQVAIVNPASGTIDGSIGSQTAGGTDGTGTAATLEHPQGIGNYNGIVYLADGPLVRQLSVSYAGAAATGTVTTVAGNLNGNGSVDGSGTAASFTNATAISNGYSINRQGQVFVLDGTSLRLLKYYSNAVTTIAASVGVNPTGVAMDASGNAYVTDAGTNTVLKVTQGGGITTFAGSGAAGHADGPAPAATFDHPVGITTDGNGNFFVTQQSASGVGAVREITSAGNVVTLAGGTLAGSQANGTGAAAGFSGLGGIYATPGTIFAVDSLTIREIQ